MSGLCFNTTFTWPPSSRMSWRLTDKLGVWDDTARMSGWIRLIKARWAAVVAKFSGRPKAWSAIFKRRKLTRRWLKELTGRPWPLSWRTRESDSRPTKSQPPKALAAVKNFLCSECKTSKQPVTSTVWERRLNWSCTISPVGRGWKKAKWGPTRSRVIFDFMYQCWNLKASLSSWVNNFSTIGWQ